MANDLIVHILFLCQIDTFNCDEFTSDRPCLSHPVPFSHLNVEERFSEACWVLLAECECCPRLIMRIMSHADCDLCCYDEWKSLLFSELMIFDYVHVKPDLRLTTVCK